MPSNDRIVRKFAPNSFRFYDDVLKRRNLNNADIAELLAREAEKSSHFVQKALRRAARLALLWPEEAAMLVQQGRSLSELSGVGPYLEKIIRAWLTESREVPDPEAIRAHFLTLPQARAILAPKPGWRDKLHGDLQTHSEWSDGSGTIQEMAAFAGTAWLY